MDISNLVRSNEDLIEKFDVKVYEQEKNYPVLGALQALEITNEVQKYYVKNIDKDKNIDELLMQLYGMLQSLFVSVDALYALSYALVGSKKFLNINQNKDMRELKYIRNDVVGHPANRNIRTKGEAYCFLDKKSLTSKTFKYLICSEKGIDVRNVDLVSLVSAYYVEANNALNNLFNLAKISIANDHLINLARRMINEFPNPSYLDTLNQIYTYYLDKYKNARASEHRFLWRYYLVELINKYQFKNISKLGKELKEDIIYIELEKIYTILSGMKVTKRLYKYHTLYKSLNRFIRKNRDLAQVKDILCDFSHPLFLTTFNKFVKKAKNNPTVTEYLDYVKELILANEADLVYAYMVPLKNMA